MALQDSATQTMAAAALYCNPFCNLHCGSEGITLLGTRIWRCGNFTHLYLHLLHRSAGKTQEFEGETYTIEELTDKR